MKRQKEDTQVFFEVLKNTPEVDRNFITKSLEIAHEIMLQLQARGMTQKDLAQQLGKTEPEISRWLSGSHNFTLRSLVAIESVLGTIVVPAHQINKVKSKKPVVYNSTATKKRRASRKERK